MRRLASLAALALAAAVAACATLGTSGDPYLWLEDVTGAKALGWVKTQTDRTTARLTADPRFADLQAKALAIATSKDRLPLGEIHNGQIYNLWQDDAHVRGVWRRASLADYAAGAPQWETVFDVDAQAAADKANWVWKGATCQPNGGVRCMIALSDGGQDKVVWSEFDLKTKSFAPGGFALPQARSSVAWKGADTLLVATDWGPGSLSPSGYPLVVKAWKRGAPLTDASEVTRGKPTDVGVFVSTLEGEDGTVVPIATRGVTFFDTEYQRLDGDAPAVLPLPAKSDLHGLHKGELVFTIQEDWKPADGAVSFPSGSLLSSTLDLKQGQAAAQRVKLIYGPAARETVEDVAITRDAVLVAGLKDVKGRVLRYGFDGSDWVESQAPLPSGGAVSFAGASSQESQAFLLFQDFTRPSTLYAFNARTGLVRKSLALPAMYDATGVVAEQRAATSKDGTQVPYFVVRKAGGDAGPAPTILYGYGGFRISQTPAYNPMVGKLWLERGGVYVVANIRGGGEFGPAWHDAGLKTNRQRIYDDFIAVAEDLIKTGVTSPKKLGIMGGSNGGLLMGVMLTQRPELFHAAALRAPLLDMERYHLLLAGASWEAEYGDPAVPAEQAFLKSISPYRNLDPVKAGGAEPFFMTSTKDDRVHPGHARKLAARMEAAKAPFLFYENTDGGHSTTANQLEVARKAALEYVYFSQRLMD